MRVPPLLAVPALPVTALPVTALAARLSAVPLLAVLVLAPAAAHASGSEPAPTAAAVSEVDPCASVGDVPLMCQSGPAGRPTELPRTGGTPYAEAALLLVALGSGAVLVGRRTA